jgi:ketosteroid isomerase-like protein
MADIDGLVNSFITALEGNGTDALAANMAPRAVVWHNHDRLEVDAIDNMAGIGMLGKIVHDAKFKTVRLTALPDGFLLQFVLRGIVTSSGKPFEMQNVVIITTAGGRITRIDEYVDPTVGAQLSA